MEEFKEGQARELEGERIADAVGSLVEKLTKLREVQQQIRQAPSYNAELEKSRLALEQEVNPLRGALGGLMGERAAGRVILDLREGILGEQID